MNYYSIDSNFKGFLQLTVFSSKKLQLEASQPHLGLPEHYEDEPPEAIPAQPYRFDSVVDCAVAS